jgi:hypothetical protein
LKSSTYILEKTHAQAKATALLTEFTVTHGDNTMLAWRKMLPEIWTTYRDGYVITGLDDAIVTINGMSKPAWWFRQSGFFNPTNLNLDKDAILFATDPSAALNSVAALEAAKQKHVEHVAAVDHAVDAKGNSFSTTVLAVAGGVVVGLLAGQYAERKRGHQGGYKEVPSFSGRRDHF